MAEQVLGGNLLSIHLDGRPYGLPLAQVLDVCRSLPVTVVPGAPPHVLGLCSWRGRVVPCIGLHHLGLSSGRTVPQRFLFVLVRLTHGEAALVVEEPVEVVSVPPPGAQASADAPGVPAPLDVERWLPVAPGPPAS